MLKTLRRKRLTEPKLAAAKYLIGKRKSCYKLAVRLQPWFNWFKDNKWLWALFISLAALCISISGFCQSRHVYEETTRPLALYNLVSSNLKILDDKLDRAESWISEYENAGTNVAEWKANLQQARLLREDAEAQIVEGKYTQVDMLIQDAYELVKPIPIPFRGTNWGAGVAGIIGGLLLIAAIVYLLRRRKEAVDGQ